MAIADRLNKLRTDIEDTYQAINEIGGTIPSDKNTNNIPEAIRSIYDNLPKVSDTGTNVSLNPTLKGRLGIVPKGSTLQDGEPSPETPVEIQSATGTQKVVVSGKNLFDKNSIDDNKWLAQDGTLETANQYVVSDFIPVLENTQYYLPMIDTRRLKYYGSNKQPLSTTGWDISSGATEQVITIPTNAKYVRFSIHKTVVDINAFQFEKGTQATPYQPYQEPQEVDIELSSRNKWGEEWEQGYYNANGNPVGNTENAIRSKNFIPVLPETNIYYYNGTNNGGRICFYDNNKNFISTITNSNAIRTTPANCYYIMFSTSTNYGSTYNNDICINISDEKNGTYTPYYNYTPNKIGDYEDYIDGTPDNWVLYKKTRKISLNISDMNNDENYPGWKNQSYLLTDYPNANSSLKNFTSYLCNISNNDNFVAINTVFIGGGGTIFLSKSVINLTQTQWKTQYPNLIFKLAYGLQTAEEISITEEPLVSQLNELYYLQSYNDTTNIDVTGNLPMRITASAIKGV